MKDAEEALLAACDAVVLVGRSYYGVRSHYGARRGVRIDSGHPSALDLAQAIDHWRAAKAEGFVSARAVTKGMAGQMAEVAALACERRVTIERQAKTIESYAQEIAELRANNEALVAQVAIFETRAQDLGETLQRAERECEAYLRALRKLRAGD